MNFYLVDYENVKVNGLDGIDTLSKEDIIYIFYSKNADTLTFEMYRRMNESDATIHFCDVEVGGKNALDFQLASQLGYLICENQGNGMYYIVSKDNGFGHLLSYWTKKNVTISQLPNITGKPEPVRKVVKKENAPKQNNSKELDELVKQAEQLIDDKEVVNTVVSVISQYKTKQGIHNALIKKYPSPDNKRAREIYQMIKPLIADKKGK